MNKRLQELEEEVRKLGFELCNAENYIHENFGDVLTLKSKDVEIFVGTLQDLERWMQGFKFARQREWVGLTDAEIAQGLKESWVTEQAWQSAVWWAEEKLKEKNA